MRKLSILIICLLPLFSCEKVWVEDLQEKAYDTIRGRYEIESAVWEEAEPIDINGDGHASFDYYAEWNSISVGGPGWSNVGNERGLLCIPYVVDSNADWNGYPSLGRRHLDYKFKLKAVIEGNESHLEFELPDDGSEFTLSGYGEITLRTKVTIHVLAEEGKSRQTTGTILIKYIRSKYQLD